VARILLTGAAVLPSHPAPAPRFFETQTSNVISLPLVLLLGCSASLEARCRSIGARGRVLVRSSPVPMRRTEVAALKPLVIVVPAPVYEGAPWGFEVLAEKVGATLLVLDHEASEASLLEVMLMESLVVAARTRRRGRASEAWFDW
jgi:hypothetical protein